MNSAPLPDDDPLMIAWKAYKETDEYKNIRNWASHPSHVDGSLWASFVQGYRAAAPELLECVKAALNMIDGDGLPPNWDMLRAAIAKATGNERAIWAAVESAIRADERERAAKVAEIQDYPDRLAAEEYHAYNFGRKDAAAAIRALGDKP